MSKKLSQTELRQMMQKLKTEKGAATGSSTRLKKYKLSTRELELIEVEKKRKAEEEELDDDASRERLDKDDRTLQRGMQIAATISADMKERGRLRH